MWNLRLIFVAVLAFFAAPDVMAKRKTNLSICKGTAFAINKGKSVNAFAKATSKAIAIGCGEFGSLVAISKIFAKGPAGALAGVIAGAQVKCATDGPGTLACAQVKAFSLSVVDAFAVAIAKSAAKAAKKCQCGDPTVLKETVKAKLVAKLISVAIAAVKVDVCVADGADVEETAVVGCLALQLTKVFAAAIAEAIVEGDCVTGPEASIKVKALVGVEIVQIGGCLETLDCITSENSECFGLAINVGIIESEASEPLGVPEAVAPAPDHDGND